MQLMRNMIVVISFGWLVSGCIADALVDTNEQASELSAATTLTFSEFEARFYLVENINYNEIGLKIRIGAGQPDVVVNLDPGQALFFPIDYTNGQAHMFSSSGWPLQQLDLNNGHSGDDLNAPLSGSSFNSNNTLHYKPGNGNEIDLMNFNSHTYVTDFVDQNGINNGVPAHFRQSKDGAGDMVLDISIN